MNKRRLQVWQWLVAILLVTFVSSSSANVMYDVVVDYENDFRYTFSMEFADPTGIKAVADLISPASDTDLLNERFFEGNTEWAIIGDLPTVSLMFDPATLTLSFFSLDVFSGPPAGSRTALSPRDSSVVIITDQVIDRFDAISTTVTTVPEPAAFTLACLGLVGLAGIRRRAK